MVDFERAWPSALPESATPSLSIAVRIGAVYTVVEIHNVESTAVVNEWTLRGNDLVPPDLRRKRPDR